MGIKFPTPLEDSDNQILSSRGRQRCQMPGVCPGGGGTLKLRFDRHISTSQINLRELKQPHCGFSLYAGHTTWKGNENYEFHIFCCKKFPRIWKWNTAGKPSFCQMGSLRKHPFLLALRRWERFARRNVCDSGPVQKSCFCHNSGIKFDKSTAEARRLNQTFELSSASN